MQEPTPEADTGTRPAGEAAKPPLEDRDYRGILTALIGKKVTIVNPESYEAAPVGFTLKEGFYDGKVAGLGRDYLVLSTVFVTSKKEGGKQPVKQFIPLQRIKRISLTKDSAYLHL